MTRRLTLAAIAVAAFAAAGGLAIAFSGGGTGPSAAPVRSASAAVADAVTPSPTLMLTPACKALPSAQRAVLDGGPLLVSATYFDHQTLDDAGDLVHYAPELLSSLHDLCDLEQQHALTRHDMGCGVATEVLQRAGIPAVTQVDRDAQNARPALGDLAAFQAQVETFWDALNNSAVTLQAAYCTATG